MSPPPSNLPRFGVLLEHSIMNRGGRGSLPLQVEGEGTTTDGHRVVKTLPTSVQLDKDYSDGEPDTQAVTRELDLPAHSGESTATATKGSGSKQAGK